MAFKNLTAFGAGELTPELYERGNLDKFRTGLKTLRNATVTKMGGLRGRAGTLKLFNTLSNNAAKFVHIPSRNYLLVFTPTKLTVYTEFNPDTNTFTDDEEVDLTTYPAGDDPSKMHITYGNRYAFVFVDTLKAIRIDLDKVYTDSANAVSPLENHVNPIDNWTFSSTFSYVAGGVAPTGYDIDYAVTFVYGGVETFIASSNQTRKKPVNTGEHNIITAVVNKTTLPLGSLLPDEVRIYQRPRDGGAYLYVGNSSYPVETATTGTFQFKDFGVDPDPTNLPPEYTSIFSEDSKTVGSLGYDYPIKAKTGLVYQDRLIFSGSKFKNRVLGSRTGATAMTRDFPLQADSAVSFRTGSDGGLEVNRFFDGRGLMIFTSVGVYETPTNLLTPDSSYAVKRGPYVADANIEPLQLGGHVTIYDRRLKAVIGLVPAGNYDGYAYNEFSIFSNHLIKGKRIVSWALENGDTMILWMVLDDGKVLAFSYQDEQLVRSWSRHDFRNGLVEEVFVMSVDGKDVVCFCVNRDGERIVERLTERDADFLNYVGTDSTVIYRTNVMASAAIPSATVAPVTPGDWEGDLTITPDFGGFGGVAGDILRVYTNGPWEFVDLEITDNTAGVLTVTPSSEYPSTLANLTISQGIWKVFSGTLTGLDHLEGLKVSVRLDGFTHASPLNTEKDFTEYTVSGGEITLSPGVSGAVISVGLPIVTDIETLEIDTVEQAPTKLEGQIVNNLWLSYFESLFLYAAAEYPDDDTITGMENQEYQVETDDGILSTQPPLPISERLEMQIQGDWKVKGSVALRNVDPQPIALRAIIPDTEVVRK